MSDEGRVDTNDDGEEWGRRARKAMVAIHQDPVRTLDVSIDGDEAAVTEEADRWDRRSHLNNLTRVATEVQAVLEPEGRVRFVDNDVRWALGYSPDLFARYFGRNLVHEEDRIRYDQAWEAMTAGSGSRSRTEIRLEHADGSWPWFEVTFNNLVNDPMTGGVSVHLRDVTDRRAAQEATRASEERFRALVQHSYDAIVVTDDESRIVYATPAFSSMFGYDPESIIGKSTLAFIHPDDLALVSTSTAELLAENGKVVFLQFRLKGEDGSYRWVDCTTTNLLHHPHVRGLVSSFRDITERKQAEDVVRAGAQRLRLLLQNADGAILVFDEDCVVTWESPKAVELWGLPATSLVGTRWFNRIHGEDRHEVIRQFTRLLSSPEGSTCRIEARMMTGNATWRWFEAALTNCLQDDSINGIVANVRDTTERALAEKALRASEGRLEYEATHDHLTGLPNRMLLYDRMEVALARARRNRTAVAVLFLDLDRFKVVNDSQGHSYGDSLLEGVARRLKEAVRPADTVARFGGDEFVILAEDLRNEKGALRLAERLADSLRQPVTVEGSEIYVTASIGIAFSCDGATEPQSLVRDADAAMYLAKDRGRARVEVFDQQLRAAAIERHQIEHALRGALHGRQFKVHYQPIIEVANGQVAGVEALLRWDSPERGLVGPASFINIAEETGLIVPLGSWVFDQACSQTRQWRDGHSQHDNLFVAINLSATQLAEPSLTDDIASVLAATRIDPRDVHVEITESVLMRDVDATADILARLKVLGVQVSIDDFGTGYSSFAYLRRFPVDTLKIDKTFVDRVGVDSEDTAICEAIVNMGHTLGLEVIAEGVETQHQAATLANLGCDRAQGFLFRPGLEADAVDELLHSGPDWNLALN